MTESASTRFVFDPSAGKSRPFWRRLIPQRWYAHLILIVSVIVITFPMFYALLISTQSNPEVYNHKIHPRLQVFRKIFTPLWCSAIWAALC